MSASHNDRAAGAILGMAAGDALGAPYEFKPPFPDDFVPEMKGGGAWEVGEWTDDTSMAVPILQAAARGEDLLDDDVQSAIVSAWMGWVREAKDVGIQTGEVFRTASDTTAPAARRAARAVHEQAGRSGGNGSLMRTAPVALAYLDDESGLVAAARAISDLTHYEDDAGDACVLWSLAIRHAVLTGELDLERGLSALPENRQERWAGLIEAAVTQRPRDFAKNGWVVEALQAAWCAITITAIPYDVPAHHLRLALEAAVRGGRDADTVAAIAGALLGARWGASAVPATWRRKLHGWPGLRAADLSRLAVLAANGGRPDDAGWPSIDRLTSSYRTLVRHPHDDGVWLGGLGALETLPDEIDAVVSLCRIGSQQTTREHVEIWLIDQPGEHRNPNLHFVLADAADAVAELRAEGKQVLIHCYAGQSRTPTIGALYSTLHRGVPIERALDEVNAALPSAWPQPFLTDAVARVVESRKADTAVDVSTDGAG